jgi:oligopeptide/dipeptide ABC transporter ATP-binding protein
MSPVLKLENLSVSLPRGAAGNIAILDNLNLTIEAGEMLALVGESGSGKTIAALSIMQLLPRGAATSGAAWLGATDLTALDDRAMRRVRGREIGMVFQNPLAALNPSRTVASQIGEAFRIHNPVSARAARARALELLGEVGIPNPSQRLDDYPHQFSGGMRQRVMIATALACSPKLLIADEPTTGLDPLIARQIMALIARLRREHDMGVLFVTHDLSVVEEHADSIHVLYAGRSVEWGPASKFFAHPRHPYSEALLGSVARVGQARLQTIPGNLPEPESRPPGCRFARRCGYRKPDCEAAYPLPSPGGTQAACLYPLAQVSRQTTADQTATQPSTTQPSTTQSLQKPHHLSLATQLEIQNLQVRYSGNLSMVSPKTMPPPALADVTLSLLRGECLGVVGESGSGKTTLGRAVLQMIPYQGEIILDGVDFQGLPRGQKRAQRRKIQIVFQDPRESLNPRITIGDIIAEPMRLSADASNQRARVVNLLGRVGLNPEMASRLPGAVSGGQAQRIAIARALAAEPEIIVLDEPTSSLDVSTQAMLLNLLKDLAGQTGLSYILISHDFAVVSYMADRIAVLNAGHIVEMNDTASLIANPQHDYTKALIGAAPQLRNRLTEISPVPANYS